MTESSLDMWTSDQRRLLEAMGYTLWQVPRAASMSAAANDPAAAASVAVPSINVDPVLARVRVCLAEPPPIVGSGQHTLLLALLKAANIAPHDVEYVTAAAGSALVLPSLLSLQRDTSTRRALWPVLRGIRRTRR